MSRLPGALNHLPLPIIGSPLFIISNPRLVIEQCKAGVVGSMPALNARPAAQLEDWLAEITEMLAGNVVAGWQMSRSLLIAQQQMAKGVDVDFMKAKITTARFYADHLLTKAPGMRDSIVEGADCVTALALEAF